MVNTNWPLTVTQFSTADPFDPAAVDVWQDITTRVRELQAATGKQYELDQQQAGEAKLVVSDKDEALNPTNPQSPYSPNLKPYRQLIDQAMWPPVPVGGAVNLLNTGAQGTSYDPSFESYTTGAAVAWIAAVGGTTPVIGTTTPHAGTKDLSWSVVNGAVVQGVSLTVPCIPGQQYTASAYVRQSSASTQQISVVGVGAGTSTATTGAYVRVAVTFTATQPSHTLQVATTGTAVAGTVLLDDIQHEPGASASTATTSGPVIYGNWAGYVERWPKRWNHRGMYGIAELTCVDGLGVLAGQELSTEYANAVLAKKPDYYWRLSEPSGAASFAEVSGNGGPSLVRYDSGFGPGTYTPGTAMTIAGDPGCQGLLTDTGSSGNNLPASVAQTGLQYTPNLTSLTVSGPPFNMTAACWISHTTLHALSTTEGALYMENSAGLEIFAIYGSDTPNKINALGQWPGGAAGLAVTDTWDDGKPHLFVVTIAVGTTTGTVTLYVDGVNQGSASAAASSSYTTPFAPAHIQVGGAISSDTRVAEAELPNGTYAHMALWGRVLTGTEITDLSNAGKGYPNETTGTRIARYLSYNWVGPTSIDTGLTIEGVSTLADNTSVLNACLSVTTDENGNMWMDGVGTVQFRSRAARYLATTAKYTFGENAAGGQNPYEQDIAYDYDPTLIYNDVKITRSGGITAIGGRVTAINASAKSYGKRSYTLTINIASDNETQDHADWVFAGHSQPTQRVETITINPAANPTLWPVALGAQIGDRITVVRTTTAGYTMVGDFFIERREQRRAPGVWMFGYQASPTGPFQPGILDDTTYGRLATAGAALHASITSSATTATVDSTAGDVFTTTGTPFTATVDTEKVTVTAVANAGTDAFGRTVSNGWGTADVGGAWTTTGGAASDYSVGSGVGSQSNTSVNVSRKATLGSGFSYIDVYVTAVCPVTAAGATIDMHLLCRYADASNYYWVGGRLNTDGTVTAVIGRFLTGTSTLLASAVATTYTAGSALRIRAQLLGNLINCKVWPAAATEPPSWSTSISDGNLLTGAVGCLSMLNTGNSNTLPVVVTFDNLALVNPQTFTITRPTDGTAVAHNAGAAVQTANPFVLAF